MLNRLAEHARTGLIAARNVALGLPLSGFSLAHKPVRLVNLANELLFLRNAILGKRGLPERHPVELFQSTATAPQVRFAPAETEWFQGAASYAADLLALGMLCNWVNPRTVFEIGTLRGTTTRHLALNSPEAEVVTLDLPQTPDVEFQLKTTTIDRDHATRHAAVRRYVFTGSPEEARIRTVFGDSATFDYSPWYNKVDLFFIDGAHSYEYVRSDTMNALKCVHPGGVIAWHDFGRVGVNGVTRWLTELQRTGREIYAVPGSALAYSVVPRR